MHLFLFRCALLISAVCVSLIFLNLQRGYFLFLKNVLQTCGEFDTALGKSVDYPTGVLRIITLFQKLKPGDFTRDVLKFLIKCLRSMTFRGIDEIILQLNVEIIEISD